MDIQQNNSFPSDQERKIPVDDLMKKLEKAVHNLVRLKILIWEASAPMRESVLLLAETKSRISFLKGIDTHEGTGRKGEYRFVDEPNIKYDVVFDIIWVRAEIEKCEETIDKLQEELDTFNHKTEIEI